MKPTINISSYLRRPFWFKSFGRLFIALFLAGFCLPVQAVILDWSGVYEVEVNTLQAGDFEQWGSGDFFHNLHLKPDIKAFDGVHVRSWFLLTPQDTSQAVFTSRLKQDALNQSAVYRSFQLQKGINFGNPGTAFPPVISVRDLYLEVVHDFGLFQIGWKPHHFGLGMYYNDSVEPFSSFYNSKEGSTGFLSWRGFIGSSYYVQPMVHYIDEALVNLFIQAGFKGDKYGAEIIYKSSSLGLTGGDSLSSEVSSSYLGVYGSYAEENILNVQMEVGKLSGVYGGVINVDWQTPVKWLNVGLDVGASTSDKNEVFYFHPSFSSRLSFLIEEYEALKSKKAEGTQYPGYSFHSGFYIAPSVHFSLSDSLSLRSLFSTHLSYSNGDVLLYHLEMALKYQIAEGLTWNTGVGVLFPKEDNWHIGFISQAAITF